MEKDELSAAHNTLIGFTKRAEKASEESLVATFVDSAPLFTLLSTSNNQVIYGRRGTGKTHALKFLAEHVEKNGDFPVFVDLRTVGSNGSIYSDGSRPLEERASVLLSDALSGLVNEFYSIVLRIIDKHPNPDEITRRLDTLQESLTTVKITGGVEREEKETQSKSAKSSIKAELGPIPKLEASLGFDRTKADSAGAETSIKRSGREKIQITFGSIAASLADMVSILGSNRVWLLIDEWSEVPVDLQPFFGGHVPTMCFARKHNNC